MWETYDDVELCVDVYQLSLVVDDWQGGDALRNELVQGLDDRGLLAGGLKRNTNLKQFKFKFEKTNCV